MEEPETLDILATLVPFTIIVFIIAIGVVLLNQQFRKNLYKQQLEKESLKIKHQEKLLQTAIEVQEEERKRIARDLHDELGAALSISRMQLLQLERAEKMEVEKVQSIRELIENTLASTRRISHELMPLNLESLGLENALRSLLSRVEETGGLKTNITINQQTEPLPTLIQLALYRIYSELVNNTLKYAQATSLDIRIVCETNCLYCSYTDNGSGLPENHSTVGLGFKSIENRINTLNGVLEYGTGANGGFYAQFELPLQTTAL